MLNKIWNSPQITLKTKLRIFNSNVKSVVLYGCERWKMTYAKINYLQVFINMRLKKFSHSEGIYQGYRISYVMIYRKKEKTLLESYKNLIYKETKGSVFESNVKKISKVKQASKSWTEVKHFIPNHMRWRQW